MNFYVISFYTRDWLYPDYAQRLIEDCDRLGLQHHIVEKPSTNKYVGNCQIKPFFIQECMERFQSPVLWMDADGSILQKPELLLEDSNQKFDLIGNVPDHDPSRVHVGSMLINYTDKMIQFIDLWCAEIKRKSPLDDAAFNGIWDSLKLDLRFRALPPEYFYIQKNPNDPVPRWAVIMHRLSRSELKERYKAGER